GKKNDPAFRTPPTLPAHFYLAHPRHHRAGWQLLFFNRPLSRLTALRTTGCQPVWRASGGVCRYMLLQEKRRQLATNQLGHRFPLRERPEFLVTLPSEHPLECRVRPLLPPLPKFFRLALHGILLCKACPPTPPPPSLRETSQRRYGNAPLNRPIVDGF